MVLFLLSGAIFVFATDQVAAVQDGDYAYTTGGSPAVATVTGYTGVGGVITIPSTLGGYATVAIGDYAFSACIALPSVTIPSGITYIGNSSFSICWVLSSINIPNSATALGDIAFYGCKAMTSATIGSGVTTIGNQSFAACSNLTSISFMGFAAPTSIGVNWIQSTASGIAGHALAASNFPQPGGSFRG